MKKSLLMIFAVLGLVSLMAEGGPKRSSIMSLLGIEDDPTCCDVPMCCADNKSSCCDITSCCSVPVGCCSSIPTRPVEEDNVETKVASSTGTLKK